VESDVLVNVPRRIFLICAAVVVACCFAPAALALDPNRALSQYNCRTWTREVGLPGDGVTSIAETRDGYIWLGTASGVVSFDGIEFKLMDMSASPSPIINAMAPDQRRGLWFGTQRGGFGYCDGKAISHFGGPRDDLNIRSIIQARNGDVWIGAETKLVRLRGGKAYEEIVTNRPSGIDPYDARAIFEDSRGRIWIVTTHQGLYYWEKGRVTQLYQDTATDPEMHCVIEDKEGRIWVGTDMGPLCWDANLKPVAFPHPWWPVRVMLADRDNVLWMGTVNGGLIRYAHGQAQQFTQNDGLADDVVLSLASASDGALWVGTRNGVSELSDVKIPTFGSREGMTAKIAVDICPSHNGGLWVATEDGLGYFDSGNLGYSKSHGVTNGYISRVFEARNQSLYVIDGDHRLRIISEGRSVSLQDTKSWPTAFAEDSKSVLVAIYGKLYRIGRDFLTPYSFNDHNEPLLGRVFNMAVAHDDSILIACDYGICRVANGSFRIWGKADGLPDSKVTSICEDSDGVVWAGTDKGLGRLKNGRAAAVTEAQGLFDNLIYAIVPDNDGNLWIDCGRGFAKASLRGLNEAADTPAARLQCAGFGAPDAVKTAERFQQQFTGCKTPDGRIWFPTARGIALVDPAHVASDTIPPIVAIRNVRANGRNLPDVDRAVAQPGRGELEFQYAGLNYLAPLKVRYRYMLEGYDKDWVDAGNRRIAFYVNLHPGQYRFRVQACNQDGVWNTAGAESSVKLPPRIYQTGWFRALAAFAAIAAAFVAARIAVNHINRKERRLRQARDLLEATVEERTRELREEIDERKRIQAEIEKVHRELVDASRLAGKAEVASSVLHNVGNVLNSVNTSTGLLRERLRSCKASDVKQFAQLLSDHRHDLADFLAAGGRQELMIKYLKGLAAGMEAEHAAMLEELKGLTKNVDHIKEIVAMQQNYARVTGILDNESIAAIVEDALRIQAPGLEKSDVQLVRDFSPTPTTLVDRHKVLQILVNLIANSRHALVEVIDRARVVTVSLKPCGEFIHITITDNGVGISAENLQRVFSHGFTTRRYGHGFGLHSGSLAAKEMGGRLRVHSDGPDKGAAFTLEIPIRQVNLAA